MSATSQPPRAEAGCGNRILKRRRKETPSAA